MTGKELERRLRKLARRRGLVFRFDEKRGKGSHGTFHFGNRRTTVKDRKKEIGEGLLGKMLDDLGLARDDL